MPLTVFASLMITYAVVQTVVFIVLLRLVDPYEREPLSLLGLMAMWGAIGATSLSAIGNVALRQALPSEVAVVFGRAIYAPLVEESAKGLALVAFVVLSLWLKGRFGMPAFEGLTDGIVYGAAVGLGFAFTEDVLYLLTGAAQYGLREGFVDYLGRRDFFGLAMFHHALYTAVFGVGLGLATWSRSRLRALFPIIGLIAAMALHAFNNGWVEFVLVRRFGFDETLAYLQGSSGHARAAMRSVAVDASASIRLFDMVMIAMFVIAVASWVAYQRAVIRAELEEEARTGLITRTELKLLPRYWQRTFWYLQLIRNGQWERWRILKRSHNELVALALLKRRVRRGSGDPAEIGRRRRVIENLKAQKAVFI